MDTAGSPTCTRMVRTAAEAELGVLIMFWTLLQSTGKGEGRGPGVLGSGKTRQVMPGKDGGRPASEAAPGSSGGPCRHRLCCQALP